MRASRLTLPVFLALVLTTADALKPPVIDDTAYLALARQMARNPLDPYGFEQFWYSEPEPANHVLAPPVLPYWLSLGIHIFGERPTLLKLWLFPLCLLFVISLQALLRRFARTMVEPMLVLAAFSPAVLPAWNLMIDLPSLAFSLAAMATFFHALDRQSGRIAILAGLLAGLAMQTKYTGFLTPPLLMAASVLRKRIKPGLLAGIVAISVFAAWESFMFWKYGESHFLYHLRENPFELREKLDLAPWLITLVGGLAPGIAIAAMARWRIAAIASALALFAIHFELGQFSRHLERIVAGHNLGQLADGLRLIYFILGIATILGIVAAFIHREIARHRIRQVSPRTMFLVLWVAVEIAGYFAMTPFPASRRILGMTLALTILAARIVAATCRQRKSNAWLAIVPGVMLGLYFAFVDAAGARLEPTLVINASEFIRERDPLPTIWYVGHWGFQFEADRQGMRALAPGRSTLHRGDWLVLPDASQNQQDFTLDSRMGPPIETIVVGNRLKRSTRPEYYGGPSPLAPMAEVRLTATIYQIREAWTPKP